jgi:hypothetical protein
MNHDTKTKKLTHGEAFFERKKAFELSETSALNMRAFDTIPPRMSRDKAVEYYTDKLRKVFGVEDKEVTPKDFLKTEHYYDYFEAKRIVA